MDSCMYCILKLKYWTKTAAKSLQSCPTLRPHRRQPTRLPCPWDSPGKNTGVGCHFLLQCMRVKSESEVAQLCLTPSDSMDCSLPGSSVHGIFQARVLEWGAIAFSGTKTKRRENEKRNRESRGRWWKGSTDAQSSNFVASELSFPKHLFRLPNTMKKQSLTIWTLFYRGREWGLEMMIR